jgi:hypothetical protein
MIPLTGILRETVTENSWAKSSDTSDNFELPDTQPILTTRVGFRWGGMEPVITPTLAMEFSAWYELEKRTDAGAYGYNHDRNLNNTPQRVFARTLLRFTTFNDQHYVAAGLQGGAAFDSDRMSCYRLGGVLTYTKEFPIYIPGYYMGEISAQDYGEAYAMYTIPFGPNKSWAISGGGAAAVVKYEDGMGQAGSLNSGVGGGLLYRAPSHKWRVMSLFGYGIQAKRSNGDGGYTLSLAFQYIFGKTKMASDEAYDELRQEYLGSEHSAVSH